MKRLDVLSPDTLQAPEKLENANTEGDAARPSFDQTENEHFSVGGLRHMPRVNYPLPRDPHATPGPDAGAAIDSRRDEIAIENDTASRAGHDVQEDARKKRS